MTRDERLWEGADERARRRDPAHGASPPGSTTEGLRIALSSRGAPIVGRGTRPGDRPGRAESGSASCAAPRTSSNSNRCAPPSARPRRGSPLWRSRSSRGAPSGRRRSSSRRSSSATAPTGSPSTRSSAADETRRCSTSRRATGRSATGELVLVDAGAEVRGYDSDITRTFPVSGRFSPEQAELYALVLRANRAAIELCAPGTEWRDVHRAAGLVLAEGLVSFGLLRGKPESLVESGAVHVFFPHGVGHMVGLGARDAGEVLPGRDPGGRLPAAARRPAARAGLRDDRRRRRLLRPGARQRLRAARAPPRLGRLGARRADARLRRNPASRTTCSSPRTGTRF